MDALRRAGKNRAPFTARLIADRDDVSEMFAVPELVENALGLRAGNVDADQFHCLYGQRIQLPRFQPGAFRFHLASAEVVQERFGHLAAGAVVNANEEDFRDIHGVGLVENQQHPLSAPQAWSLFAGRMQRSLARQSVFLAVSLKSREPSAISAATTGN